jgi:glycosyltransferase involved in cell wall biosynthesis
VISFIVPVLNKPALVIDFLKGLTVHCVRYGTYEVVFVDNGSDDLTYRALEGLKQRFAPCVEVVHNERNEGFGPANNKGAEYARGDVLVFTQPDVTFHGDVIEPLQQVKNGYLYGARLLDRDTGWNRFGKTVVPYLEGWFLCCTATSWNEVGGFDPRYVPADFEDVDLSWHWVQKGHALIQLNLPVSHDHMGASAWSQFTGREQVTIRNRDLFAEKWGLVGSPGER